MATTKKIARPKASENEPSSERRVKVSEAVPTLHERILEAAELCTANDHICFDAVTSINELTAHFFSIIDKAVESGTMSGGDHALYGCEAGGAASLAIERVLQLRGSGRIIADMLAEIAKDIPGEDSGVAQ